MTELQAERAGEPLGVPRIEAKSKRLRYLDVLIAVAALPYWRRCRCCSAAKRCSIS